MTPHATVHAMALSKFLTECHLVVFGWKLVQLRSIAAKNNNNTFPATSITAFSLQQEDNNETMRWSFALLTIVPQQQNGFEG